MKDNQTRTNTNNNMIDIVSFGKKLWTNRKLILKFFYISFIIGLIASLSSPSIYSSQTTFVPQVSDYQMSSKGNLSSLASLTGINITQESSNKDSYLSPLLYSKIADSEEFSLKLINEEIINLNGDISTIKDYMLSNQKTFNFNLISLFKKYTIDLFFNNKVDKVNSELLNKYNFINPKDYALINSFRKKFIIELNEKEGYIKVIASDKDPFISSQLVEKITKNLQAKIIKLRTNKIKERLEYSKEQYELKQSEFDLLQKNLAEFKDSNKNISTARFRAELQKLESEYELQKNILINLASEYNNNKIKLNKDTPIFSVIDQVSIPNSRSGPKRVLIIIIYVLIGLIISCVLVLGKQPVSDFYRDIIS